MPENATSQEETDQELVGLLIAKSQVNVFLDDLVKDPEASSALLDDKLIDAIRKKANHDKRTMTVTRNRQQPNLKFHAFRNMTSEEKLIVLKGSVGPCSYHYITSTRTVQFNLLDAILDDQINQDHDLTPKDMILVA